jgi:23S rRNA (cytidine1920-2'-O)/16S rRNA (cytidine1409-2'-O)-methyltransferase
MAKLRLDKLIFERGLAESRARAQAMIIAGQVLVREQRADKPGQMVDAEAEIRIKGESLRYVSRGGLKLEQALLDFDINPEGKTCIDIGASTGGFTDCLLQRGAAFIWAVDVGHNQLAWRIRNDPKVKVSEGVNARYLDSAQFNIRFDLAVIDVSFISLTKILPVARDCIKEDADIVALIKPQFEVGKGEVGRKGIVADPAKHRQVLMELAGAAVSLKLKPVALIESPILGAEGNREFLIHLKKTDDYREEPVAIEERIKMLTSP